jgi:hypothetical protein
LAYRASGPEGGDPISGHPRVRCDDHQAPALGDRYQQPIKRISMLLGRSELVHGYDVVAPDVEQIEIVTLTNTRLPAFSIVSRARMGIDVSPSTKSSRAHVSSNKPIASLLADVEVIEGVVEVGWDDDSLPLGSEAAR